MDNQELITTIASLTFQVQGLRNDLEKGDKLAQKQIEGLTETISDMRKELFKLQMERAKEAGAVAVIGTAIGIGLTIFGSAILQFVQSFFHHVH